MSSFMNHCSTKNCLEIGCIGNRLIEELKLQREKEIKAAKTICIHLNFLKLKKRLKLLSAIKKLLNNVDSLDMYIESNIYLNFASIHQLSCEKKMKIFEQKVEIGFDSSGEICGRISNQNKFQFDSKYKFLKRFKDNIIPNWIGCRFSNDPDIKREISFPTSQPTTEYEDSNINYTENSKAEDSHSKANHQEMLYELLHYNSRRDGLEVLPYSYSRKKIDSCEKKCNRL